MRGLKILTVVAALAMVGLFGLATMRFTSLKTVPKTEVRQTAREALGFGIGAVVAMVAASIGAAMVVARAKREFRELAGQNLRELVEGTREDIARKRDGHGG